MKKLLSSLFALMICFEANADLSYAAEAQESGDLANIQVELKTEDNSKTDVANKKKKNSVQPDQPKKTLSPDELTALLNDMFMDNENVSSTQKTKITPRDNKKLKKIKCKMNLLKSVYELMAGLSPILTILLSPVRIVKGLLFSIVYGLQYLCLPK